MKGMAVTQIEKRGVQKTNRNRIYRFVYEVGATSKPEIAQRLGISLPTAIQNVKLLQQEGLLLEGEALESTGGRKAMAITCNKSARYALGVDITKNHISAVVIDLAGEIVGAASVKKRYENTTDYYKELAQVVNSLVADSGVDTASILGVGFSVPGAHTGDGQMIVYSHVLEVSALTLSSFSTGLPFPAVLCNDANAAGIAEMWSEPHHRNAVYFSLSNSVGGSIILQDALYLGENHRAGEFGHMTLVPGGVPCYCGRKGCVDAYCSAQTLSQHTGGDLRLFFERLEQGDEHIKAVWQQYLTFLATAINNLTISFDCRVVLGGYLGEYLDHYLVDIRRAVSELATFAGNENYVTICKYKKNAAAVGAALLYVRPFIEQV